MKLTAEQSAVVHAPRGNLLVSAAAGSGKTAVLTDRIVHRILGDELDMRQVLVMTFTEAAARNMREKIEHKLRSALTQAERAEDRQRISRQLALLPGAAISTIHAFCLDIIRNFYHCARDAEGQPLIEPGFRVDDGVESDLLLQKALDEWMTEQYEQIDRAEDGADAVDYDNDRKTAFYRLIEGYGSNGKDRPVKDLMLRLIHFMRSLPDYNLQAEQWLVGVQSAAERFSDSRYLDALLQQLILLLDKAREHFGEMSDLLSGGIRFIGQAERNSGMNRQFAAVITTLRELDQYLRQGGRDWDTIRSMRSGLAGLDLPRNAAGDSPEKKAFMALFVQHAAEIVYCLTGECGTPKYSAHFIFQTRYLFNLSADEIEADIKAMLPPVQVLFDLVLGLDRRYTQMKQAAGMIDFSDFEHLALAILREEEASGYYRSRFTEIYVDEYQDTSSIQEAIIAAVSNRNCFMVGDIKQSIYRFRHARPRIFIDRAEAFQDGKEGSLHELNRNFRSVAGVLDTVNDLFSQIMSRGAGEIDYDQRQALVAFRENPPDIPTPVSLLLINRQVSEAPDPESTDPDDSDTLQTDSSEPDLSADELSRYGQESLAVVACMINLHAGGTAWRDMVVLSRTRAIGQACREQLEKHRIPVLSDLEGGFLESPVMRQMEALLRLLDNQRQDIPLAAVLRAAIWQGGFSDDDLVRIRLFGKAVNPTGRFFHEAVSAYAEEGPDDQLKDRLAECLEWLNQLRQREQLLGLSELFGLIFDESGWLERLAARPEGQGIEDIRQLRQFRQWAEQFEARRPRGLHAFVDHIDSLRRRGSVPSPLPSTDSREDAVQVMTIHGSKGLEFPVVFIVGTGYNLTPKDRSDSLLISESMGIGMDYADPQRQIRYPTHLKLAMQEELRAASLAEELRLLYVAMTRAMNRLFIVGSVKIGEEKADRHLSALVAQVKSHHDDQLPPYLVLAGRCYLDWIFMALARQPGLDFDWLSGGSFPDTDWIKLPWRVEFLQMNQLLKKLADRLTSLEHEITTESADDDPAALLETVLALAQAQKDQDFADLCRQTSRRIAVPYRFETASRLSAKLTVSELKRREQAIDPGELPRGVSLILDEWNTADDEPAAGQSKPTAVETGIWLHDFFRYVDLPALCENPREAEIIRQLAAMRDVGIFREEECAALKEFTTELFAFAASDLARAMVLAGQKPGKPVYNEMPFTLAVPACEIHTGCAGLAPEDTVKVQGIIDCWFEGEDGITLVDYKSDRLPVDPAASAAELGKRYGLQLDYYSRAIEAAVQKKVKRRVIWLIRQGRAVDIPAPGGD